MPIKILKENLKKITLIVNCFLCVFTSYLFAADKVGKAKEGELTSLQEQARLYRVEGVKFQDAGDLDSALTLYQKAVELDPVYAVVCNDLGIIYEAQGQLDRAEDSYLQALKIDPRFLGVYTNLAFLYEDKRDLDKAVYYWKKRAELGDPDDPWTMRAEQRLKDVRLVLSQNPMTDVREKKVNDLAREVGNHLAREKAK
ncbi:MAG: tetratricopeptide repeat protein [Candidatus Omnitrophota bacterium]|nr:tetratricopeptide repeat protein [Candidatus Omnitrophota bacterium]